MSNTTNQNSGRVSPKKKKLHFKKWLIICVAYVFILYSTLPLGRPAITWLRNNFSHSQQNIIIYSLLSAGAFALLIYIFSLRKKLSPLAYVCFIIIIKLYYFEFTTLVKYPEERLHFLEYGILACLLQKTFSKSFKGVWAYVFAAIIGILIGWGDEGIQLSTKFIPELLSFFGIENVHPHTFRRYFGWGDVKINALGILYGLAFMATVIKNVKPDFQNSISKTNSSKD